MRGEIYAIGGHEMPPKNFNEKVSVFKINMADLKCMVKR